MNSTAQPPVSASSLALGLALGLGVVANAAAQTTADFSTLPTSTATSITSGWVTATGERPLGTPALVHVLNFNGIGVVGGIADSVIDTGERLRFTFDAFGRRNEVVDASFFLQFISNADGDGNFGEYELQAFRGSLPLGTVNIFSSNTGANQVSSLFSNQPLTAFEFTPSGDHFRIRSVTFTVQSADRTWTNPQSGFWDSGSNWDKGTAPYERSAVSIEPSNGLRVTGPFSNTTVHSLSVGATTSGIAVLEMSSGDIASLTNVTIQPRGALDLGSGRVLRGTTLFNLGKV